MSSMEEDHQHNSERRNSNASSVRSNGRRADKAARKRKREDEDSSPDQFGMGSTLSVLRPPDLPGFNLTSTRPTSLDDNGGDDEEQAEEWTTVVNGRPSKKAKKIPKSDSQNYPAITFSSKSRFNSSIKIADLQGLVLYLLADGPAPQWVSVRNRPQFRKVVVLMIPGLEKDMFIRKKREMHGSQEDSRRNSNHSPDDYYPVKLSSQDLPKELEHFQKMFEHAWPVQTPGDDKYSRMHSPLHAMLTAPAPREKEDKKQKKGPKPVKAESFAGERTRITEFLCSITDLEENEYVLHPAMYDDQEERAIRLERRKTDRNSQADGWVDTLVDKYEDGSIPEMDIEQGSLTAGRTVLAMDCEMCMTDTNEFSLTRISIVAWDGSVIMDELVKPAKPITDYLTMYSGITEAMLENVETTLQDIQQKLLTLFTPQTILIGHSLNSDLTALKITHPYIIDTALIYPHPRGPPLKQSLKYLAQKYLNKTIQAGHGAVGPGAGHNSIEDARTCLDLVKQKCEKGKSWGNNETGENLFKRLARAGVRYKSQGGTAVVSGEVGGKTSAAIDWGDPKKGAGAAATVVIGCRNDEDVVAGIKRAVLGDADGKEVPGGGVDFVWARLRELESLKGWWNENKARQNGLPKPIDTIDTATPETAPPTETTIPTSTSPPPPPSPQTQSQAPQDPNSKTPEADSSSSSSSSPTTQLLTATTKLSQRLQEIYDFLPPCTALIIYSGSGDPREMSRLQQMQATFKREYRSLKWDELSVRWTDVEEQALKKAAKGARGGVGFVGVK